MMGKALHINQLIFILKILFTFFNKTSYLGEEVNCTEGSPSARDPWFQLYKFSIFISISHNFSSSISLSLSLLSTSPLLSSPISLSSSLLHPLSPSLPHTRSPYLLPLLLLPPLSTCNLKIYT
jgi:hypothetical protein